MTDHDDLHEWAGAYATSALDRDDRQRFEAHLRTCTACQATVAELLPLVAALGRLDDQDIEPLTPAPDTILAGAVARATAAQRTLGRSRARWRAAAVAALVVAVSSLAGLVLASRGEDPPAPAGREVAMAGTAAGSVELVTKGWGTQLRFEVQGLPVTGPFVAVARDRSGRSEVACSWGETPSGGVRIDGATSIPTDDLAAVEISDLDGTVLAVADLATT